MQRLPHERVAHRGGDRRWRCGEGGNRPGLRRHANFLDWADAGATNSPWILSKARKERAEAKAIEDERLALEEYERNKPLIDKARVIIALARTDPKAAARKVYQGMKERALAPYNYIKVKGESFGSEDI